MAPAIILAAGLGVRLQPLTFSTPKPLVDIAPERTLLGDALVRLSLAGYSQVLINNHHLGEQLEAYVAGYEPAAELKVIWSRESQLLGTGGALKPMLPHLALDAPVLIIAADIWTTCPIPPFVSQSVAAGGMHLMLVPNPSYNPKGDFDLASNGDGPAPLRPASTHSYNFGGMALIDPILITRIKAEVFSLKELMDLALEDDTLTGQVWRGPWFNVGTAAELATLRATLAKTYS